MSKLTLVILAAGMGSRYGGVKQMEGLGPDNEVLLDYSVYDAIRAGIEKVVIVIRPEMEADFRERVSRRFENKVEVAFAYQSLDNMPADRVKPMGTGHALLCAAECVEGPFGVINADDFYGVSSFQLLADSLKELDSNSGVLVGFRLGNTLSASGAVSRAVCQADSEGKLTHIQEHTRIFEDGDEIVSDCGNTISTLDADTPVSLNLWGFPKEFFPVVKEQFEQFFNSMEDPLKDEFYLPSSVFSWIQNNGANVHLTQSNETWLGLTYPNDKDDAKEKLAKMVEADIYPASLWNGE